MKRSESSALGWRSRWLRYAYGVSAAFGLGVIAGMVLSARLSRTEVRVGK